MTEIKEGYKKTEIGVIPVEWDVVKLNKICKFKQGIQVPLEEQHTTKMSDTIRFLRISDYTQSTDDIRFVSKDYSDYIISSDDVVMVRYGETAGFIGTNLSGVLANNLFSINPNEKIIKKYLYTYLNDEKIYNYLKSLRAAGAMPAVSFKSLNVIKIPLPPLKEQEKIADILSTADERKDAIAVQIEKAKTLKIGLLQKLLSEGINHSEFKDSELGKIPKSWEVVKLDDMTIVITKGTTPTTLGFNYEDSGINFIKVESIGKNGNFIMNKFAYISEEANNSLQRSIIKENDLLLSIAGALGRVAIVNKDIVPANTNQALSIIRLKDEYIKEYVYFYLNSSQIQNHIDKINVQNAQANLSLQNIKNFKIALPPLKEQKQIAEILSTADKKLEVLRAKKDKHETLKIGLLQKLLSGEVRV
ncbi:Type I restriction-modification system, specificity subunit S [hydrothermal vent metagenome]|uniref:Type I restriction-modification system, specificity subunit S n=1 Tax=hydrothermal vent metagenome TaxID=652676 RepID=A0A3B1EAB3_9ZZZZ